VDWGSFSYVGADGRTHRLWAFVMGAGLVANDLRGVVRRADVASFCSATSTRSNTSAGCRGSSCLT